MNIPLLLFGCLTLFLILRVPIGISLGMATLVIYWVTGERFESLALSYYDGLDRFPFLAVPMFLLAGALMERGGISRRLISVSDCFVGNVRGGLAHVTILSCMLFSAISGSGPATTAAVGGTMIPTMIRRNYDRNYSAAVAACGGTLGILIPPSIALIVYGVSADESITRLFVAGFLPGLILGIMLMCCATLMARLKTPNQPGEPFAIRRTVSTVWESRWALMAPVVILGGIYGGFVTPTESAVLAVLYGFFVGMFVYKELNWAKTLQCLETAAIITGTIAIIWGASLAFGELITIHQVPQMVTGLITGVTKSPFFILLLISLFLTFVGMWLNTLAQVLILTPIFLPVIKEVGIDPVHFGIVFVVNCEIGYLTPPLGTSLFVALGIADTTLGAIAKAVLPFIATMFLCVLLLSYFPNLSLFLPNLLFGR
ncbi:MAG: TRAP transporter large permease [Nitrospinota bacterium]